MTAAAGSASGGECRTVGRVTHHYPAARHVQQKSVVKVVEKKVVVPVVAFVAVEQGAGYYGGSHLSLVGPGHRDAKRSGELAREIERLTAAVNGLAVNAGAGGTGDVGASNPVPLPAPLSAAGRPELDEPLARQAVGLLSSRCADCHTAPGGSGRFSLFDEAGELIPVSGAMAVLVDYYSYDGSCPKGSYEKFSDDEYAVVRAYLQQFAGDVRRVNRGIYREDGGR